MTSDCGLRVTGKLIGFLMDRTFANDYRNEVMRDEYLLILVGFVGKMFFSFDELFSRLLLDQGFVNWNLNKNQLEAENFWEAKSESETEK